MSISETSSLRPYTYRPLTGPRALRLLKLRPGSPSQPGDIDCDLLEATLNDLDSAEPQLPQTEYEAVSWCWGREEINKSLRIHDKVDGVEEAFSFKISPNLESALRAFRYDEFPRLLWVDAICINQKSMKERNEQVPKMNQIYGQAMNVCIWVGDADESSQMAMNFIRTKVLKLWEFDKLCENLKEADSWLALVTLMKRPWFSRRWVVQEIALANHGTLYCGRDQIDWQDFADAVSLFVEVESATHRLSEVMKHDTKSDHIPNFFGHVPALGAALLVDATGNLFRSSIITKNTKQERLLSLEHLVSKYSVFEATQPRDTIYALLAIASDTTPQAPDPDLPLSGSPAIQQQLSAWGRQNIASEVYNVDYRLPVIDVYKEFIAFAIRKSSGTRALDIICRPWAPRVKRSDDQVGFSDEPNETVIRRRTTILSEVSARAADETEETEPLPSWIPDLNGAAYVMNEHKVVGLRMERKNADPLVGLPIFGQRNYSAAGTKPVTLSKLKFEKRQYCYSMFVEGFRFDQVKKVEEPSRLGNVTSRWLGPGGWNNTNKDPPPDLWRTLVANRGPNGRNPPTFYPRACKESMSGLRAGGTLDTQNVIDEGRCTIVAEFLRRVQAVIWNRCLMRTEAGRLGLVHEEAENGDYLCVLYGCSVPVVLRKVSKTSAEMEHERAEDEEELQSQLKKAVKFLEDMYKLRLHRRAQSNESNKSKLNTFLHAFRPVEYFPYFRLIWLLVVAVYIEVWLHLTLQTAIVATSSILLFPQLLLTVQPTQTAENALLWRDIRQGLRYARMIWLMLVSLHVALSKRLTVETALAALSFAVLCPQLLPSSLDLKAIVPARWRFWQRVKPTSLANIKAKEPEQYYWKLIGESYVHGMMDGEAIKYQNEKHIKAEIFELR